MRMLCTYHNNIIHFARTPTNKVSGPAIESPPVFLLHDTATMAHAEVRRNANPLQVRQISTYRIAAHPHVN